MPKIDAAALTADLIKCPSVTPEEGGALVLLQDLLSGAGFDCQRVDRGGISNLFARWGDKGHAKTFGFNGHTDVVPVGDEAAWTKPPFGAVVEDGIMFGRGATDMKSGVAAFASLSLLKHNQICTLVLTLAQSHCLTVLSICCVNYSSGRQ